MDRAGEEEAVKAVKQRVYHYAAKTSEAGVSALCFKVPRAIDMKRASWTLREEAVTCPKCKAALV